MSDSGWEEEHYWSEETTDKTHCEYGVCEACCEPQIRKKGLCTTQCHAYHLATEADDTKQLDG